MAPFKKSNDELPATLAWQIPLRLSAETDQLANKLWPPYLVEESDIPNPRLKFTVTAKKVAECFPAWGIRERTTGQLVAFAKAVMISTDSAKASLPDLGWQFAIEAFATSDTQNCMCLLAANVDPQYQHLHLSRLLLEKGKEIAYDYEFQHVIGPVRPSKKHLFPEMAMEDYLKMKSKDGEIYDPWLRTHVRSGAEVLNICHQSVQVHASLAKWREWTHLPLDSGEPFTPQLALNPATVNWDQQTATYCEPNVWVRYSIR